MRITRSAQTGGVPGSLNERRQQFIPTRSASEGISPEPSLALRVGMTTLDPHRGAIHAKAACANRNWDPAFLQGVTSFVQRSGDTIPRPTKTSQSDTRNALAPSPIVSCMVISRLRGDWDGPLPE